MLLRHQPQSGLPIYAIIDLDCYALRQRHDSSGRLGRGLRGHLSNWGSVPTFEQSRIKSKQIYNESAKGMSTLCGFTMPNNSKGQWSICWYCWWPPFDLKPRNSLTFVPDFGLFWVHEARSFEPLIAWHLQCYQYCHWVWNWHWINCSSTDITDYNVVPNPERSFLARECYDGC